MSDSRELRRMLEASQAEVTRLTRELEKLRTPDQGKVATAEANARHAEQTLRDREASWREREQDWQRRERATRDELDEVKAGLAAQTKTLERTVRQLAAAKKASALAKGGTAVLKTLLPSKKLQAELDEARAEIARLNQRLSLAGAGAGRRGRR